MDAFWLIPAGIVVGSLVVAFCVYLHKQPLNTANPCVLLHKEREGEALDPAVKNADWSGRPCGSFMDWILRRG